MVGALGTYGKHKNNQEDNIESDGKKRRARRRR